MHTATFAAERVLIKQFMQVVLLELFGVFGCNEGCVVFSDASSLQCVVRIM